MKVNRLSRAVLAPLILVGMMMPWVTSAQSLLDETPSGDLAGVAVNDVAQDESPAVRRFQQAIAQIESDAGPYAPGLSEQLLGLGALLQQRGEHQRAADILKRGVHVARINGGLYSTEQIPLLRTQIESLLALGEFAAVDERQRYLYRVERRALGNGVASINALLRQGEWQRDAYLLALDETELAPQRLLIMWDVYRLALNQMIELYGSNTPELLPALEGMLTSQYLISGYRGFEAGPLPNSNDLRLTAYTSEAYKRGKSVLRAIMEINAKHNGDDPVVRAHDLQRLGDWAWWFGNKREAMQPYGEAWALGAADESGVITSVLFSKPQPLPSVEGIMPIPAPMEGDAGELVVSFDVTSTGRVRGLERLRGPEVEENDPTDRLIKLVKRTRFRPRMEDGEPVPTEGMVWSFNEEDWLALQ